MYALSFGLVFAMTFLGSGKSEIEERVLRFDDGRELRYTISKPEGLDPSTPAPLILALHYGWQGELPRYYGRGFLEPMVEPAFTDLGAIILAPDCPDSDWRQPDSERALLALLDEIRSEFSVANDKIVVTGYSLGGMGAWFLAATHPDVFSAAIPIAAPPKLERATSEAIVGIPLYAIHGRLDEIIPLAPVQEAIEELRADGASIEFVVVEGASHYDMGWYVEPLKEAADWLKQLWSVP